jgi:hypothetical protein
MPASRNVGNEAVNSGSEPYRWNNDAATRAELASKLKPYGTLLGFTNVVTKPA